jgi:hypothetical protein
MSALSTRQPGATNPVTTLGFSQDLSHASAFRQLIYFSKLLKGRGCYQDREILSSVQQAKYGQPGPIKLRQQELSSSI